jgi:hypothetical protein
MYLSRTKSRPKAASRPLIHSKQLPAPTRGLDLHDGIASMKPADALVLDNWFPEGTFLRVRGGVSEFAYMQEAPAMYSLMEWAGPSTRRFFAATETDIYDITDGGAIVTPAVEDLTSGYWQTTMIATAGGHFLVAANGANDVLNFDGTDWTTPSITGVSSDELNFVCLHKSRLWFVENNSTKAWYLPTNSIAGAAVGFELGASFSEGGKLVAIGAVSRDGGSGSDDYLAFVSSRGQVVIYQGDDPASASTWARVGVYDGAPPIGNRSTAGIGGDLAILTESAIVSTRQLMSGGQASAERQAITKRIDQGIMAAFASYGALPGWSVTAYPRYRLAVFNVPTSSTTAFQFVVNTETGAWCTYSSLNATCWGCFNEQPYFGRPDGYVYRAEDGYSDQVPMGLQFINDDGEDIDFENDDEIVFDFNGGPARTYITAQVKTSFQTYGRSGGVARMTMIRPLFTAGGQIVPAIRINTDYQDDKPLLTDEYPLTGGNAGSTWDAATWDEGVWGGSNAPFNNWYAATGIGTVASVNMITQTRTSCILNAFDLKAEVAQMEAL